MGWGVIHRQRPVPAPVHGKVAQAGRQLAAAVREWNASRSLNSEERMVEALRRYEATLEAVGISP